MGDHEGESRVVTRHRRQIDGIGVTQVPGGIDRHPVVHDDVRAEFAGFLEERTTRWIGQSEAPVDGEQFHTAESGGHLALEQRRASGVAGIDVAERVYATVRGRDELARIRRVRDHRDHERLGDTGLVEPGGVRSSDLSRRQVRQHIAASTELPVFERLPETGCAFRMGLDVLLDDAHGEQVAVGVDDIAGPGRRRRRQSGCHRFTTPRGAAEVPRARKAARDREG